MTPEDDIGAIAKIEADIARLAPQYPRLAARVSWLCARARALGIKDDTPKDADDRDVILKTQADRIVELEGRLRLTPDEVFAAERAEIVARDANASGKGLQNGSSVVNVTTEAVEVTSAK